MAWYIRKKKGISTAPQDKKKIERKIFYKTPTSHIMVMKDLKKTAYVCPQDNYHLRVGSEVYFNLLFDDNKFAEFNEQITATDPLRFVDKKSYKKRLQDTQTATKLKDAIKTAYGRINNLLITVACMDFSFIGGSMGIVVGEKIARAIDYCIAKRIPLLIISKSGGARMMESSFALMQMAKISAKLLVLAQAKIPYISLLTDPTTGGVTASFAMLGDFNLAEPGALIGFAGPRIIKELIKKKLPEGFQRAEFLLKHGFIDFIVDRRELKEKLTNLLKLLLT